MNSKKFFDLISWSLVSSFIFITCIVILDQLINVIYHKHFIFSSQIYFGIFAVCHYILSLYYGNKFYINLSKQEEVYLLSAKKKYHWIEKKQKKAKEVIINKTSYFNNQAAQKIICLTMGFLVVTIVLNNLCFRKTYNDIISL